MRDWLLTYLGEELRSLRGALLVPLGPKVSAMLDYLADQGIVDRSTILDGLPHPSGANAERIAYFLGQKPRDRLSTKRTRRAWMLLVRRSRRSSRPRNGRIGGGLRPLPRTSARPLGPRQCHNRPVVTLPASHLRPSAVRWQSPPHRSCSSCHLNCRALWDP